MTSDPSRTVEITLCEKSLPLSAVSHAAVHRGCDTVRPRRTSGSEPAGLLGGRLGRLELLGDDGETTAPEPRVGEIETHDAAQVLG
jgi:hypothetical protein